MKNKFARISKIVILFIITFSFASCQTTKKKDNQAKQKNQKTKSQKEKSNKKYANAPKDNIIKVKKFRARQIMKPSMEAMIPHEYKHIMHGAVSPSQIRDRHGDYFTCIWKSIPGGGTATLSFDYYKEETGGRLFSKKITPKKIGRKNITRFEVIGSEFENDGAVTSWKITLSQNGKIIGEEKSFLWKE